MLYDFYHIFSAALRLQGQKPRKTSLLIWLAYARIVVKRRIYALTKTEPKAETFLGFKFRFFRYSSFLYLIEEIFVNGLYRFEPPTDSPVIFDCGSNIGVSVIYFKWRYPDSQIVAFEPDPRTFELLQWNVAQNGLKGVTIHNVALSESRGEITFHSTTPGALSASILETRVTGENAGQKVPTFPLSSFIKTKIDLMKMDIEGAEIYCIPELAASGTLSSISHMVIECHHNLRDYRDILTTVMQILEAHKFSYQLSANLKFPVEKEITQDVMLYAHQLG